MAPLLWKAPWRRAINLVIHSDTSGLDVGSGPEQQHGNSQGEHAKSSHHIASSTKLELTSRTVFSLATENVLPPTNAPPSSSTDVRFLSTFPSDAPLSFPSPPLHFVSKPLIMTSSPYPTTSSPPASSWQQTQKTEPSVAPAHVHDVLSSPPSPEDVVPTLTSSNYLPSSTKDPTTTHSGGSLRPTECMVALPEMPSATRTLGYFPLPAPACSLFPQDGNTRAHSGILNTPSPPLVAPSLGIPELSSYSTSPSLSATWTLSSTSASPSADGDEPVRTSSPLSDGLRDVSTPGSKTPRTTSVLSTTSAASPSVVITEHAASAIHSPPVPSDTPQKYGRPKPEPTWPGSSVSPPLDSPSSFPVEVGGIAVSTAYSSPLSTTTLIASTTVAVSTPSLTSVDDISSEPTWPASSVSPPLNSPSSFPVEVGRIAVSTAYSSPLSTTTLIASTTVAVSTPSLTSVDGISSVPFSSPNQFAVVDDVSSSTAFGQDVTSSFTTIITVVTFSPIQISGTSTSVPVTRTIQTVLPTVLPAIPVTGKKSVPVAAIVAPVSAAVILALLLIGIVYYRKTQRASLPEFNFSPPAPAPAPAMSKTEPVQQLPPFKEVTVLPPIPTIGGWSGPSREAAPDPFADPDSTLEKNPPSATRLPTPDPFADPPALLSTTLDGAGDGPSRLSEGSTYDGSFERASISSSHVGYAM